MTPSHGTSEITSANSSVSSAVPDRDGTADGAAGRPPAPAAKRRRINFACNYCRNRKTRCDEQKPSCMACITAGVECITTDRRRPGVEVSRRETRRRPSRAASTSSLATPTPSGRLHSSPTSGGNNIVVGEDHDNDTVRAEIGSTPGQGFSYDGDLETPAGQTKFQGKLPVFIPGRGSNSAEIIADWLDLACRRLGLQHRCGLPQSSRRQRPLLPNVLNPSPEPCHFPPADIGRSLAVKFFDGINILFPILSREHSEKDVAMALELGPRAFAEARGIAVLAQMYSIWAIGFAAEPRLDRVFDPEEYLDYCKTLLGHLLVFNSVENVRAIVLLAICLNTYDNCAGACNTFSIGVSMAMTLGLHQLRSGRRRSALNDRPDLIEDDERRLLWLAIYAYEKLLSFELSRPSMVHDRDCYPLEAHDFTKHTDFQEAADKKAFNVILDLARVLGEIGRKSVAVSRKEEQPSGQELQAIIAEKVQTVAESTLLLTHWAETVPEELRPTSDPVMNSKNCPFASYIAMHYNNALLVLSRNTLLISKEATTTVADIIAKGKPWGHVVRNGQSIAANAARKILNILLETLDSQSTSIFSSWLGMLHAFATLAIHIITHPGSRISTMDFHLMQAATDFLKGVGSRMCDEQTLNSLLKKIDKILAQQQNPPPALLANHSNSGTTPASTIVQDSPQTIHGLNSADRSGPANNRPGSTGVTYDIPEADLFTLNEIISGASDFGDDSLYSAMSILSSGWPPGMPDSMGTFMSGSIP